MREPSRKLVYLLWTVIAVLIIGAFIGGIMLMNRANALDQSNTLLTGDNDSLRRQLKEAKTVPAATPSPVATPTPTPVPTVSPKATITPKAAATPGATSSPGAR